MAKLSKSTKNPLNQRLLVALVASFLLTVLSFGVAYSSSQHSSIINTADCGGDIGNSAVSADGLVIAPEADLRCAGEVRGERSSQELIKSVSILVGVIGAALTLVLLAHLLKSRFCINPRG